MPNPSFVSHVADSGVNGGNLSKPTGTWNLLIEALFVYGLEAQTLPTGFSVIQDTTVTNAGSDIRLVTAYRQIDSSIAPATYAVSAGAYTDGFMIAIADASVTGSIGDSAANSGVSATGSLPAVAAAIAGSLYLGITMGYGSQSTTVPSGLTVIEGNYDGASNNAWYEANVSGAIAAKNYTLAASDTFAAHAIIVAAAGSPAAPPGGLFMGNATLLF